jgi:hypothetical protein
MAVFLMQQAGNIFCLVSLILLLLSYKVYWSNQYGWCVAAGVIHGASVGDKIVIDGVCETIIVDQRAPDFSVLLSKPQLGAKEKEYQGRLILSPSQKIKVGFAEDLPVKMKEKLQGAYDVLKPDYIELTGDKQPKYYIRNSDQGVFIALPESDVPVFNYAAVETEDKSQNFIKNIGVVANWLHLLELNNPSAKLSDSHYEISISKNTEAGNFDPASFEEVNDLSKPIELWYQFDGKRWRKPALQLTLKNKSGGDLWFSCLFMGVDYSINGSSLKEVRIASGKSAKLTIINEKGVEKDVLLFDVGDDLVEKGYNDITEYLKIFVSAGKINTSGFSQDGLDLARITKKLEAKSIAKGINLDEENEDIGEDWKTETIGLHIVRPKDSVSLEGSVNVNGVIIEAPASFSARVALVSSMQTGMSSKSIGQPAIRVQCSYAAFPALAPNPFGFGNGCAGIN